MTDIKKRKNKIDTRIAAIFNAIILKTEILMDEFEEDEPEDLKEWFDDKTKCTCGMCDIVISQTINDVAFAIFMHAIDDIEPTDETIDSLIDKISPIAEQVFNTMEINNDNEYDDESETT